jgi:hypothetical protein
MKNQDIEIEPLEREYFGEATVATGTSFERKIKIISYMQANYKDNRLVSIVELENNEGYMLTVENPPSSGRNTQEKMWLSKESFIGLIGTAMMFYEGRNMNLGEELEKSVSGNDIHYSCSPNVNSQFFDKSESQPKFASKSDE